MREAEPGLTRHRAWDVLYPVHLRLLREVFTSLRICRGSRGEYSRWGSAPHAVADTIAQTVAAAGISGSVPDRHQLTGPSSGLDTEGHQDARNVQEGTADHERTKDTGRRGHPR